MAKQSPSTPRLNLMVFFVFVVAATTRVRCLDFIEQSLLTVPSLIFLSSLKTTLEEAKGATSIVSKFVNEFEDLRVSSAIKDCVDLLDFTMDELSWTLSATESLTGKDNVTVQRSSDLKAWLSAALGNQDTCIEGFEGTNSVVKNVMAGKLQKLTSQVAKALSMVRESPSSKKPSKGKFPAWMMKRDRRLLQAPASGVSANVVVAADGSGSYTSVMDAILAAPDYSSNRYVIYVKKGFYKENVEIKKKKWNLMLVGDGMGVTVISGSRSVEGGYTTFRTATFAVSGKGFIARDITFENTAGPQKQQAVALRSDSDLSVFYNVDIRGYQDTLYTHSLRQFYRECRITGTIDFIFGNGAVVFQNCQIVPRKSSSNQWNTITAQGRKDPNQSSGFSFQFCAIAAGSEGSNPTYLGRPWKQYSRTVFMQCSMSSVISPEGWREWAGNFALSTLYYGEYMNTGPGAGLGGRVKWSGYHVLGTTEASRYTVGQFINGNQWLPQTGIKYTAGF
ncbi:hypothetical protein GIB67_009725 [Kingdonia uniflora]|uniref:Pectinesterase n=1 Tax=Kingdonia uniflora TaxID=39325 RepID=A0A7J7LBD4_9MAGN|nr:hypothetical protein GIB67_009725 [Kingdonia uniflora]